MGSQFFKDLLDSRVMKYVFLGGPGGGKSELAIHYALSFANLQRENIHFFDMDQSKPLCRSRDVKKELTDAGIHFHSGEKFLDAPIVPKGVEAIIADRKSRIVFDVGGGPAGACNIGQYAELLSGPDTVVYFLINCFRPFCQKAVHIEETITAIKRVSGLQEIEVISNPFSGAEATAKEIVLGHQRLLQMMEKLGMSADLLAVPEHLWDGDLFRSGRHVFRIRPRVSIDSGE